MLPLLCLFLSIPLAGWTQRVGDPEQAGERLLAVVPIVGAGTYADPRRPLFTPAPGQRLGNTALSSFKWKPSDDGKFAIVDFRADEKELDAIASDARVVKAFRKGKAKKDDIDNELRRYRKDFWLEEQRGGKRAQ